MQPHEYTAAVNTFVETITSFLFNWKIKFNPDKEEMLAMAEALEKLAENLKQKASEG